MELYWVSVAKKRMRELGITQSDLLDVFGVTTRGAVGHYFSGRQSINVEQLEALSEKLNQRIDYYEKSENGFSSSDIERVLDTWLPRLSQVGLVEYKADVSAIKKLLTSALSEQEDSDNDIKKAQ